MSILDNIRTYIRAIRKPPHYPLLSGPKTKYIFIHINKTGGTSIAKAIGLQERRHFTVKEVIRLVGRGRFNKAYVFSVVRNPWDRVVSHYKYRTALDITAMNSKPISFKEWVKRTYGDKKDLFYYNSPKMFAPQVEWLKDNEGKINLDKILRFENLAEDFQKLESVLGMSLELPHLNATGKENYTKYYDEESIEIVHNWFKEDIELFNYSFENHDLQ